MQRLSTVHGLDNEILKNASSFDLKGSLPQEIEAMIAEAEMQGLEAELALDARRAVGLSLEAAGRISEDATIPEMLRKNQLGRLLNKESAAAAGQIPERLFRSDSTQEQWLALMEILNGIDTKNADLGLLERAGIFTATSPFSPVSPILRASATTRKLAMKVARKLILKQTGGFVRIFKNGSTAENMIASLEEESEITGIGYQANLVTESARSEGEARKNIGWYKKAVVRLSKGLPSNEQFTGLAIKPTSIVPFSDSAIARPVMKKRLVQALSEIFEVAEKNRLPDGKSVMITIDSERSDIFDMVGDAIIEASKGFPRVRMQVAMQAYLHDTEKRLLDPFLEESARRMRDDKDAEPLGARLVGGANLEGEKQLHSAMGWYKGIPVLDGRDKTHANFMRLRKRMTDPLKEGKFSLTVGSMNLITVMDTMVGLAKAGVFASENQGYISFAMLRGMTGQEVFGYLKEKYTHEIEMEALRHGHKLHFHEYIPVISMEVIVELFKYYLRRIEELVGGSDDGKIANYLGIYAKHGADSPKWRETQVRNGVLKAMLEHQKTGHLSLDPRVAPYRGQHEPLIIPAFAADKFQELRVAGVEIVPATLEDFQISPSFQPGNLEDSNWIDERITNCKTREASTAEKIELAFPQAEDDEEARVTKDLKGPTLPDLKLASFEMATKKDINKAYEIAKDDKSGWGKKSPDDRIDVVVGAIAQMREHRGVLDESLMLNIGKSVTEADAEVCEAVDFLNLSALQMKELLKRENLEFTTEGDGTAVVICPKNFPIAIPLAHIVARLLAGYRVIVKPSGGTDEESVWATYEMVKCLWAAGVKKDTLIFLPCDNENAGYLTEKAERCGYTGSTKIAKKIQNENPDIEIIAETGGRNVVVVDSTADLKTVATEVITSVCHFAGQKCSKPVMVMLTEDVNAEKFNQHLLAQMLEMLKSTALDRHVDLTPLSKTYKKEDPFYKAVMECLPEEAWLQGEIPTGILDEHGHPIMKPVSAKPEQMGDIGIRWLADPENFDWSRLAEIFAPILTVTQIKGGVPNAIDIIKKLKGSLTGALFSQNRDTIQYARDNWKTGNLYINKKNTGARADQGFGDGTGDSHLGTHGAKTGTPEFLIMNSCVKRKTGRYARHAAINLKSLNENQKNLFVILSRFPQIFGRLQHKANPQWSEQIKAIYHAGKSYLYENQQYYSQKRKSPYQVDGQYDWIESHNIGHSVFRLNINDTPEDIFCKIFSAIAAGNRITISADKDLQYVINYLEGLLGKKFETLFPGTNIIYTKDDEAFSNWISEQQKTETNKIGCILYSEKEKVSDEVFKTANANGIHIDGRKATGDGRIDMITQFRQQSYCWVYHTAGDTNYEKARLRKNPEEAPYAKAA